MSCDVMWRALALIVPTMRSVVLDDNEVATILSELVESVCEGAGQGTQETIETRVKNGRLSHPQEATLSQPIVEACSTVLMPPSLALSKSSCCSCWSALTQLSMLMPLLHVPLSWVPPKA